VNISLKLVVCGNIETASNLHELCDDAAQAKIDAACDALNALDFVGEVAVDRHFPNWNGGKYAYTNAHNKNFGDVACPLATVINGEEQEVVTWAALPAAAKAEMEEKIWAALKLADAAAAVVQAEHEAEDGR